MAMFHWEWPFYDSGCKCKYPKGHTFLLVFLSHIMCMFARLLWVALRTVVMHQDIHNPVCFLVAASQDRPGLGTPGNVPFCLLGEGETPSFLLFAPPNHHHFLGWCAWQSEGPLLVVNASAYTYIWVWSSGYFILFENENILWLILCAWGGAAHKEHFKERLGYMCVF